MAIDAKRSRRRVLSYSPITLEDELDELRHELAASRKAQRRAEQERDDSVRVRAGIVSRRMGRSRRWS